MTPTAITTDDIEERFVAAHIALANAGGILLDPVPSLAAARQVIADTTIALAGVVEALVAPIMAIKAVEATDAEPVAPTTIARHYGG